ncbi:MAG: glycerophosphodiester phosphodiesterase family protein [Acidimicrobiia bacterium]
MILVDPLARPVIAHRGASGLFPENTLLAFRKAIEVGADALEFDVRVTGDGIPVVIHDATVDRTTDGVGAVSQLTLAAISEFNAGEGENVSALEVVLEATEGTPLIVEIKDRQSGRRVAETIRAGRADRRVLVGSFESEPLVGVRAAGMSTTASRREARRFWIGSRLGWWGTGGRYDAFSLPEYRGRLRVVDRRLVRVATRIGRPVHVWTVDDREAAQRLRSFGVAGIITNFPDRMRELG